MPDGSTRALVAELYGAYSRRDFDRVAALVAPDIDWVIYGPVHIFPFAGVRRGKRAVLETLGMIVRDYALDFYAPEIIVADSERAAVMSDVCFVQRATQRKLRFRVADFLHFRDRQLVEFREFANMFDLTEQALGRLIDAEPVPAGCN